MTDPVDANDSTNGPKAELTVDRFVDLVRDRCSFQLAEGINPYDPLDDQGVESLDVFELMLFTESIAGCIVPPLDVPLISTLADAYEYYWACRQMDS